MSITDAVILMAGTGSRLRGSADVIAKPLIPIAGRSLISYAIDSLDKVGIKTVHAVVGPNGEALAAAVAPLLPSHMRFRSIPNPNWQKQNGISLLATAGSVTAPFLLTMGDHLFESSILETLIARADVNQMNLAVDRKIDSIFDLEDAMKVKTEGDHIVEIGKKLEHYDAIDTGIFLFPETIFDYLRSALKDDDCSLADGVRLMADDGRALAIDIGEAWWQDVDTPEMLARAEQETARIFCL